MHVDPDRRPPGFHASTADEFASGFEKALSLPDPLATRRRARKSAARFAEEEFAAKWITQVEKLVTLASEQVGDFKQEVFVQPKC